MRINARLEPVLAKKVLYLKEKSGDTTSGVLKRAIELYYQKEAERAASPFKIFEAAGFVGCAPGPAKLSENYKAEFAKSLRGKHRAHRR